MLTTSKVTANVPVSDLDRARRFYADVLGLTPADENPGGLVYTTDGGTTFFLYQTEYAGQAGHTIAQWHVGSVDDEVRELKAKGLKFEHYDMPDTKWDGDIARMDENGYFYIVDRKKDMILVSGFNVYPNEVEDAVMAHPGVLEVAAVGVPDEHSGEVVKLFVVRKDPNLTEEALRQFCRENLTGYKRPKLIEFRDSLPKSNVGKILRRELRDEKKPAG